MREVRLGDVIDDFCVKCKRIMNHSVVSMVGSDPAKVRCRTCNYEHGYRKNKGKKEMTAAQAFDKVLASVTGSQPNAEKPKSKKR